MKELLESIRNCLRDACVHVWAHWSPYVMLALFMAGSIVAVRWGWSEWVLVVAGLAAAMVVLIDGLGLVQEPKPKRDQRYALVFTMCVLFAMAQLVVQVNESREGAERRKEQLADIEELLGAIHRQSLVIRPNDFELGFEISVHATAFRDSKVDFSRVRVYASLRGTNDAALVGFSQFQAWTNTGGIRNPNRTYRIYSTHQTFENLGDLRFLDQLTALEFDLPAEIYSTEAHWIKATFAAGAFRWEKDLKFERPLTATTLPRKVSLVLTQDVVGKGILHGAHRQR